MKNLILTSIFISFTNFASVYGQCVSNVSATLTYLSSSGGNCTYNFTPSALINNTPNVKLVQFILPTGSSPSEICYSGNPISSVPCTGGYTAINNNSTQVTLPTVQITIPCSVSSIEFKASTATTGASTCAGSTNITITGANPIKLSYFSGIASKSKIILNWQTEAESNNAYFVVQKSSDAKEFSDLEIIKSIGESTKKTEYNYIDMSPLIGINYYRLRQVDNDGSYSYSKIIDIKPEYEVSEIILYPNPSTDNFILKSNEEILMFEVFSITGEKIDTKLEKQPGEYMLNFIKKQDNGTYFLKLKTQKGTSKYRIIVD